MSSASKIVITDTRLFPWLAPGAKLRTAPDDSILFHFRGFACGVTIYARVCLHTVELALVQSPFVLCAQVKAHVLGEAG